MVLRTPNSRTTSFPIDRASMVRTSVRRILGRDCAQRLRITLRHAGHVFPRDSALTGEPLDPRFREPRLLAVPLTFVKAAHPDPYQRVKITVEPQRRSWM